MFSIADLESEQPEFEEETAEGEEEEPAGAIFPLRCSITVSKVIFLPYPVRHSIPYLRLVSSRPVVLFTLKASSKTVPSQSRTSPSTRMPPSQPTSPQMPTGGVVVSTSVLNLTTWTSTSRKSSTSSWLRGVLIRIWLCSCPSMPSTRSRRFVPLSERSVDRTVEANRCFDLGIRRLAAERQEFHRGVKSRLFILPVMSHLRSFPVLSRSSVFSPMSIYFVHLSLLESKV